MRTCAFEDERIVVQLVDEQPVRFDMAFTAIPEVASQWMVMMAFSQRFLVDERGQDLFELCDVFPASLLQA